MVTRGFIDQQTSLKVGPACKAKATSFRANATDAKIRALAQHLDVELLETQRMGVKQCHKPPIGE